MFSMRKNWPAVSRDEELIGIFQKAQHKLYFPVKEM